MGSPTLGGDQEKVDLTFRDPVEFARLGDRQFDASKTPLQLHLPAYLSASLRALQFYSDYRGPWSRMPSVTPNQNSYPVVWVFTAMLFCDSGTFEKVWVGRVLPGTKIAPLAESNKNAPSLDFVTVSPRAVNGDHPNP